MASQENQGKPKLKKEVKKIMAKFIKGTDPIKVRTAGYGFRKNRLGVICMIGGIVSALISGLIVSNNMYYDGITELCDGVEDYKQKVYKSED